MRVHGKLILYVFLILAVLGCTTHATAPTYKENSPLFVSSHQEIHWINIRVVVCDHAITSYDLKRFINNLSLSESYYERLHLKFIITRLDHCYSLNEDEIFFDIDNDENAINFYLCPPNGITIGEAPFPSQGLAPIVILYGSGIFRVDTIGHELGHCIGGLTHSWCTIDQVKDINPKEHGGINDENLMGYGDIIWTRKSLTNGQLEQVRKTLFGKRKRILLDMKLYE